MRKSSVVKQKDPSKSPTNDRKASWSKIDDSPSKAVVNAVSPKMIQFDREACESIVNKINQEKELDNLQKEYLSHNR